MDKKRNIFLIILSSLVSPFSLLVLFSALVNFVGSYFQNNGFLVPILLLCVWLVISGIHAFIDITNVEFKGSDTYKAILNHAKMVGVIALLLTPIVVVSSLLYHIEIQYIILACSTLFLLGLPLGIIPLLLFVRKEVHTPLVARKIEHMLNIFFPVFLGEVAISVFLPAFKFGFAFNAMELVILHLGLYFLLYLANFIMGIKNKTELQVRRKLKFDTLFTSITGLVFFLTLVGAFFIIVTSSVKDYSLEFSFENVSTILFLDTLHYNNVQEYFFFITGYVICFLSYGSSMIRPVNRKVDIAGILTLLAGALTVYFLVKIPYIPGLIMNGELTFKTLSIGAILAFAPIFTYLLFEIINIRLALKEMGK